LTAVPSFEPAQTIYGDVSSVALVSKNGYDNYGKSTPYTATGGYCPDVKCKIYKPLAGQSLF